MLNIFHPRPHKNANIDTMMCRHDHGGLRQHGPELQVAVRHRQHHRRAADQARPARAGGLLQRGRHRHVHAGLPGNHNTTLIIRCQQDFTVSPSEIGTLVRKDLT